MPKLELLGDQSDHLLVNGIQSLIVVQLELKYFIGMLLEQDL